MKDFKDTYKKSSLEFIGNSNSLHNLGLLSKKLENASSNQILKVLGLIDKQIIYTSGKEENYTFILNNVSDGNKIITDNKEFYKVGKIMNKNIYFSSKINVDVDTYLISTENDLNLEGINCLKHISLKQNYKNYKNYDFLTIDDAIPFFGCLIINKNKVLTPIIHGGKSTTKYRSGTAATPLISVLSKKIKTMYKK